MDNRPIGVMDSGLGGLSVMRILRRQMPHEGLIFVGDQGHFPYGTKSAAEIRRFALSIGRFLVDHQVKMMVVACNTATAEALPLLQQDLPVPVIGVVSPGAKAALALPQHQRIGVIATEATTRSGIYPRTLHQLEAGVAAFPLAAQPLVSVVEHRQTGTVKAQRLVNHQLAPLVGRHLDALIMGCTHFPFLQTEFRRVLGDDVVLIDPAVETVKQVADYLKGHKQLASANQRGRVQLFSTGSADHLTRGARAWLHDATLFGHHLTLADHRPSRRRQQRKTLVIATKNQGKAREYAEMFAPLGMAIKTLADFPAFPIDENGTTFEENALIKARAAVDHLHLPVLADDSGICVDALDGAPGVHSARYAGDHDFVANNAKLLRELQGVPDKKRTAHFHTTIVCLKPSGAKLVVDGEVRGHILHELQGKNGFGYDPLFYVDELQTSMGELSDEEKNRISHRARAMAKLEQHFDQWWNAD